MQMTRGAHFGMLDCNRSAALLSRLVLRVLAPLTWATVAYGQAAGEYALKSSEGAVSASGTGTIGGCRVDSTLLTCLSHSYPKTTIVVIGLLAVLILRWLTRAHAAQS